MSAPSGLGRRRSASGPEPGGAIGIPPSSPFPAGSSNGISYRTFGSGVNRPGSKVRTAGEIPTLTPRSTSGATPTPVFPAPAGESATARPAMDRSATVSATTLPTCLPISNPLLQAARSAAWPSSRSARHDRHPRPARAGTHNGGQRVALGATSITTTVSLPVGALSTRLVATCRGALGRTGRIPGGQRTVGWHGGRGPRKAIRPRLESTGCGHYPQCEERCKVGARVPPRRGDSYRAEAVSAGEADAAAQGPGRR